ncbi:BAR domain-containing family [Phaffia rhodozyma]|uniref:BAR domain-containing family n=1 Tax=Phaffia rhodozyma TaxID=264483 RepID=A0A0F7SNC3_PHARH|nr:BAR domain-containing family [Phaffia rhodozyma]
MWSKFQANLPNLANLPPLPQAPNVNIANTFKTTVQAGRERFGNVSSDEITELPKEYKDLEARVDALKTVHQNMLKITKVYETESYDYPTQITESVAELGGNITHSFSLFAQNNLKGTNLPLPAPTAAPVAQPKTLPHALSRAAASSAVELGDGDEKLGKALSSYSLALGKVGEARLSQDEEIATRFLHPWQRTLSTTLTLAIRARQHVKQARLELDSSRQALKTAAAAKQEQARLEVEEKEDELVRRTEEAIGLMKNVLENPEPLLQLNQLVKAQLVFHSTAAEALSAIQGEIEEAAGKAETEYRTYRA